MPASLEQIKRWYRDDRESSSTWREQAREDFGFVEGSGQWDEADRQLLRDQMRPVVTFNRLDPIVEAVAGSEITNRQEVQYLPVEQGDVAKDEVLTAAGEWVRDQTYAENEESDSFRDLAICGMGWTDTRISYEDDPRGMIVIERSDPLEMLWDCLAKQRNLRDARRVGRVRKIDIEDARAMFPEFEDEDLNATWAEDLEASTADESNSYQVVRQPRYSPGAGGWSSGDCPDKVTIVEYQYFERISVWDVQITGLVLGPQRVEVTREERKVLLERLKAIGEHWTEAQRPKKIYYRAICGAEMLSSRKLDPQSNGFRFKAMTGKRNRNNNTWYGIVRGGKDPQQWANKWLSQVQHIINTNAKGGIFAEENAFADPRKAEEDYARNDKIVYTSPDAIVEGRIMPRQQTQYPQGIAQLMEYAVLSVPQCMGVPPEFLGQVAREQPGVLEHERKQSGMTILATFFEALQLYRRVQGRLLLDMILRYLSDGRLIRVVGEEGAKYVPLVYQPGTSTFDVKVDDAPSSPNQKERAWLIFQHMLPMLSRLDLPREFWAQVVEYSPLPTALTESLGEALRAPQQPDPMALATVDKTRAQAESERADARKTEAETLAEIAELTSTEADTAQKRSAAVLNLAKARETGQRVRLDALESARETANAQKVQPENLSVTEQA